MKRTLCLFISTLGISHAQITAPKVSVGLPPALQTELATTVVVQPANLEARLAAGYATTVLNFTLFSSVNTEVFVKSNNPRLVVRGAPDTPIRLMANTAQPTSVVITASHSGMLSILNRAGQKIASVPYVVAPAKTVNQGLNLNYSPSSGRVGLNYSISGANPSLLDPRWRASVNLGVNTNTGQITGGVNVGINW